LGGGIAPFSAGRSIRAAVSFHHQAKDGIELPPPLDPKRFNGKLLHRLEPALHRRLAAKAQAAGESLNNYIARSLAKAA
jgi:predicted HicB family RNase H-like nuclease